MSKKVINILNSPVFWFLFFLVASVIYFWPFLTYPAFNLIDDGVSLRVSKEILSGNLGSLIETRAGRLRPVYWLYFVLVYLVSGTNPLGYWMGQTLVFALTLFSVWYLLRIKTNKWISYISSFILSLLFFVPAMTENLYRLGTAEVRQMLFMILFIIWMAKYVGGKWSSWIGFVLFVLAIFTKETSIMLLPMLAIYISPFIINDYQKHKKLICSFLFFAFITLVLYSLITAIRESANAYTASFKISWPQIKYNMLISRHQMREIYYLLITFLSVTIGRLLLFLFDKNVFSKKQENYIFQMLGKFWQNNALMASLLTGLLGSLFFVFSWEHQLGRYYYPVFIFLFTYILLESYHWTFTFFRAKFWGKVILLLLPILSIFGSYLFIFQRVLPNYLNYPIENKLIQRRWFGDYQNSYSIISQLLDQEILAMYTLIDDLEVVYELSLYTNKLNFNEHQIKTYSPNQLAGDSYQYINHSSDPVSDFIKDERKDKILVTVEVKPADLDEEFFSKQLISSDFLTKHSDRSNWVIWRAK